MQNKIIKIVNHIHHGTLIQVLKNKFNAYKQRKTAEKWERCKGEGNIYKSKLQNGIRINLFPDDKLSELIFKGNFELIEQEFVRNYLQCGDYFVDVGANIGLFTLIAANKIGLQGKVFSFEPTALTFERLRQNVQINHFRNVQCIKMALSDKAENRSLATSLDGFGGMEFSCSTDRRRKI